MMAATIGDWFQIGSRFGSLQAWGIENIRPTTRQGETVKKTSRVKAVRSGMPMILLALQNGDEEWWPLDACTRVSPPTFTRGK